MSTGRIPDSKRWSGKRVLVTGHTGFKGSWLTTYLAHLGADVCGFSLDPSEEAKLFAAADVAARCRDERGDVRDAKRLGEVFGDFEPEIVFHLAAQSLVLPSYEDPVGTYETNVLGTVNVLDCVRLVDFVDACVMITTDKVYENREWLWGYREFEELGGYDPYSNSKACAELAIAAYRRSFFGDGKTPIASARAGNVIGGGDFNRFRLVPDLVRATSEGAPAQIRRPHSVRPWQHVLDPLCGYLVLAERLLEEPGSFAEAWNFGPDPSENVTVAEAADEFVRAWGEGASWEDHSDADTEHEAYSLRLDSTKARGRLDWKPRVPLARALDLVTEWHKAHLAGTAPAEMSSLMLRQVRAFEAPA